jgi:Ca2+-binding EF-hand superfamily protein
MKTVVATAVLCFAFGVSQAQTQSENAKTDPGKGRRGAAMFQKMDLDGDGKISRDEAAKSDRKKLQENFDRIDANKDGYMDKDELKAFRQSMRQNQENR